MEWNFEEKKWYILRRMYELSDYLDYMEMDVISVYPVVELMNKYDNIILLIMEISDHNTDVARRIINDANPDIIINGIDVLIECAIDCEMHEITALLLDYKYKHGEFKERNWDL